MNPKLAKLLVLSGLLGLLFFATPLRAQVAGATLSGTITDAQGGAVAGAKVSAKNAATGISTDTATNSSGVYSIANLNPANYEVSVSATGFSTAVSKVTLTVGAQQAMNISLTVGQVSQTVEVTGAVPVVETTNATLSGEVLGAQIVELPLNGRDWAALATLQPGVVQVRPHEEVTQPGGELRGLGMQMTIDGNRPTQNVYRLNGVIVNDYSNAGPGHVLGANMGVDAIQEFSVLTSNYSAEYGFTSGGVINAITKSGTNQFHGSAYEFLRNKALDAANFFENANSLPKGAFVRNQFGASAGGPIKKNKIFFFGDYEGLRQRKGITTIASTLSPNARVGILNDANGNQIAAIPTTGGPFGNGCQFANSTNLAPGKTSVCVDTFVESFVNALDPLPTCDVATPGCLIAPDFNAGTYAFSAAQAVSDNYATVRGDVKISDKDSLNASWYRDHSSWTKPDGLNQSLSGFILPNQNVAAEETHVFSTAMVNIFRVGFNESNMTSPNIAALNPAQLDTQFGMTSSLAGPGISPQAGGNGLSGIDSFGGLTLPGGGFSDWTQLFQVYDDASRTAGNHSLKFGFMFLRNHTNLQNGNGTGSASFNSLSDFLTNIPAGARMPTSPPFTAGNTKHYNRNSVFSGYVQDDWKVRPNLTVNVGLRYEMSTIPYEIQQKFQILPEIWTNPPSSCVEDINGLPQGCSGLNQSVFLANPTTRNFEPRVGFAWDPFHSGKTSVRGGFGIFDVLPMPFMFGLNALQGSPAGAEVDLAGGQLPQGSFDKGFSAIALAALTTSTTTTGRWQYVESRPKRNYVMQWNANVQRQITPSTSITVAYAGSRGIHNPFQTDTLNTVFPTKTSAGWLFPVVPSNIVDPNKDSMGNPIVPIGTPVVCSSALLVQGVSCGTAPTPGSSPTGIVPGQLINPNVPGLILSVAFQSQSWYNSLQVEYEKRMSHGFQIQTSFTWQKSMDTSSGSFAGDNYSSNPTAATPWWDLNIIKGRSDFNVGRNLTINGLWQIPSPASFSGPAGWIARGWGVGGVLELSDGAPFWPLNGLDGDPMGQVNQEPLAIPDLASGCTPQNAVQPRNLQYAKPGCFINAVAPAGFDPTHTKCDQSFVPTYAFNNPTLPALDPNTCINLLGHLPRNSLSGPGLFNIDLDLTKDNHIRRISEAFNIQFWAEFFNMLNHANFASPGANNLQPLHADGTPVSGFGLIKSTQTPGREIQVALKMIF